MAVISFYVFMLSLFFPLSLTLADESVIVNLSSGKIRGENKIAANGLPYKHFLGIPFAKSPVGKLRLAPPEPVEPWNGIRDAVTYPPICIQPSFPPPLNNIVAGLTRSEDCLFLNVFIPASSADSISKFPVMVFIHGGGFVMGGAPNDDMSSVLATFGDVIVIGIQYRLGILGFFNVPGTKTRGNFGLMDQIEALKWVQKNIAKFGGDPSNVTIFGESAGAISVSLLMLIPQAKELFHRVIAQSGAADSLKSCFPVQDRKRAKFFLESLNCSLGEQYLDCLRDRSSDEILNSQLLYMSPEVSKQFWPSQLMTPVVDGLYITEIPRNLLRQGKFHRVPSIFGMNSDEGSVIPTMMFGQAVPLSHYTTQLFQAFINTSRNTPEDDNDFVKAAILQRYTKHGILQTPEIIRQQIIELFHDKFATAPLSLSLQSLASAGIPGYFYIFEHRSKYSIWPRWVGVNHADELPYVFGAPLKTPNISPFSNGFTDMENGLSRFIMKLWTNFAKYGNPNTLENGNDLVTWPKYTNSDKAYLSISLDCKVAKNYRTDKVVFWNEFLPKLSAATALSTKQARKKENTKKMNFNH